jgi:hypothetical protein
MLVTFEYYSSDYLGASVTESEFPKYELKARNYLEYITFNKVLEPMEDWVETKVKQVMCEVIDMIREHEDNLKLLKQAQTKMLASGIKSESVKSHSVTMVEVKGNEQAQLLKGTEEHIYMTIRKALLPTGLLSRVL